MALLATYKKKTVINFVEDCVIPCLCHFPVVFCGNFSNFATDLCTMIEGVKYNLLQKTKTILTEPKTSIFLNMFFDLLRRNKPNSNPNFTPIDPILDS